MTKPTDSLPPRTPEQVELDVRVIEANARRASSRFGTVCLLTTLAALLVLVAVVLDKNHTDNVNGDRIDALTVELAGARQQLSATTQEDRDRAQCQLTLQAEVRTTNRNVTATGGAVIVKLGDLVSIISTTPIADRLTEVGRVITELQTAGTAAQDALDANAVATDQINAWSKLPVEEQLPCPVPLA